MEKEKGTEHNIVDINLLIKRRIWAYMVFKKKTIVFAEQLV
jgi:hypothetical protein